MRGEAVVVVKEAVMAVAAPDRILSPDRPSLSLLQPNLNLKQAQSLRARARARQHRQSLQTQPTIKQLLRKFKPASLEPD